MLVPNGVTLECSIREQRSRTPHGSPLTKRLMYSIVLEKSSSQPLTAGILWQNSLIIFINVMLLITFVLRESLIYEVKEQ